MKSCILCVLFLDIGHDRTFSGHNGLNIVVCGSSGV